MTYDTNLEQTQMESMPELFHFWSGDRNEYVTSWKTSLYFRGQNYLPRPVERGEITFDAQFGPVKLTVSAPLIDNFIAYLSTNPIEPTRMKLYRAITSDLTDYVVLFTGSMRRIGIQERMAKAEFESKARQLRVRLPKILYQAYCNWDVFDQGCGISIYDWIVNTSVTVNQSELISNAFSAYDDGYFTAGRVIYGSDERWILGHTGDTITLQVPFDSRVQTGTVVGVLPGCDGSPDTCKDKFDNFDNYLGCPYIPSDNPCLYGFK